MKNKFDKDLSRRSAIGCIATLMMGTTTYHADAAVSVKLLTSNSGNKVRLRVKVSGSQNGFNFGSKTYGPIYVPRNGNAVKATYNAFTNAYVEIVAVIGGEFLRVNVIGGLRSSVVIFKRTVKKTVLE